MPNNFRNFEQRLIVSMVAVYVATTDVASAAGTSAKTTWSAVKEQTKKVPRALKRLWPGGNNVIAPIEFIKRHIPFLAKKQSAPTEVLGKLSPLQRFEEMFVNKVDLTRKPGKRCIKPPSDLDLKIGRGKKSVSFSEHVTVGGTPSVFLAKVIPVKYSTLYQVQAEMKTEDGAGRFYCLSEVIYRRSNEDYNYLVDEDEEPPKQVKEEAREGEQGSAVDQMEHPDSAEEQKEESISGKAQDEIPEELNCEQSDSDEDSEGETEEIMSDDGDEDYEDVEVVLDEISDAEVADLELKSEYFKEIFGPLPEHYMEYGMGALFIERVTLFEIVMLLGTLEKSHLYMVRWLNELYSTRQFAISMVEQRIENETANQRKASVAAVESTIKHNIPLMKRK